MNIKKVVFAPILIIIFTFIFTWINLGNLSLQLNQIVQPLIFSLTTTLCILFPFFRKIIIGISLSLLFIMIIVYLFNYLELSNWIGSLGFGMLFIVITSYLPKFIKRGHIENF